MYDTNNVADRANELVDQMLDNTTRYGKRGVDSAMGWLAATLMTLVTSAPMNLIATVSYSKDKDKALKLANAYVSEIVKPTLKEALTRIRAVLEDPRALKNGQDAAKLIIRMKQLVSDGMQHEEAAATALKETDMEISEEFKETMMAQVRSHEALSSLVRMLKGNDPNNPNNEEDLPDLDGLVFMD